MVAKVSFPSNTNSALAHDITLPALELKGDEVRIPYLRNLEKNRFLLFSMTSLLQK